MRAGEVTTDGSCATPRFRAPDGATWIHALHGNVPDHQIDFVCCPEAPQGAFTRTHLGHLARLMKYIEPRSGSPFAFAIGNLSRDDSQHEPGHGAVALLSGLRIVGEIDSAGRQDPPLAHAIIAVDRALTYGAFLEAILALHHHLAGGGPAALYREYVRDMAERPGEVPGLLERYFAGFPGLPELLPSVLAEEFVEGAAAWPNRIFVVHDAGEAFGSIAHAAAKLSALLYRSSLRWTSIVFGGVVDIPGGLSVELVTSPPMAVGPGDRVLRLEDLPEDEDAIARDLFGARRVARRPAAPAAREEGAAAATARTWEDDAPTLVRGLERESALTEGIEVEVDLGGLAEEPRAAAPPGSAAGAEPSRDGEPAAQRAPAPAQHGEARQAREKPTQFVPESPAQHGEAKRARAGGRWLRVGALGVGAVLAGVALWARDREDPASGATAKGTRLEPMPVGAPVMVDIDRKAEKAPAQVGAKAPAGAPWPARQPSAAPVERAGESPRGLGERRALWIDGAREPAGGGRR